MSALKFFLDRFGTFLKLFSSISPSNCFCIYAWKLIFIYIFNILIFYWIILLCVGFINETLNLLFRYHSINKNRHFFPNSYNSIYLLLFTSLANIFNAILSYHRSQAIFPSFLIIIWTPCVLLLVLGFQAIYIHVHI